MSRLNTHWRWALLPLFIICVLEPRKIIFPIIPSMLRTLIGSKSMAYFVLLRKDFHVYNIHRINVKNGKVLFGLSRGNKRGERNLFRDFGQVIAQIIAWFILMFDFWSEFLYIIGLLNLRFLVLLSAGGFL